MIVLYRPQFFVVMTVSAANKHTISFEILILKPKYITELNDQDPVLFCISQPLQE